MRTELTFQVASLINRKRRAAAAGCFRIGITHSEICAHQRVLVIEFRPLEQVEARRIDRNPCPITFDNDVVLGDLPRQIEFILKSVTAAGQHLDSQGRAGWLGRQNGGNLPCRAVTDPKPIHRVAHGPYIVPIAPNQNPFRCEAWLGDGASLL